MGDNKMKQLFLNTSERIGTEICKQAFWKGKQCNWIGRFLENSHISTTLSNHALGPELYDGTSGIAQFLSYLYLLTKKEDYRHTAEGAINQALSHHKELDNLSRFGFYNGYLGIACTAVKIGLVFDNELIVQQGLKLLKKLEPQDKSEHLMDIISGNAGAIPALLEIYDRIDDKKLFDLSLYLGSELISSAIKNKIGWSWSFKVNGIRLAKRNLTGFSHGAAGIGYSLLELYHQSHKKEFREGAEQAFAYENHWFSKKEDNWPDFRTIGINVDTDKSTRPSYAKAWCHGAPGIGLSRLRAVDILDNERYLNDSYAALRTTIKFMEQNGTVHQANYSLCHGLSGNSECLIYASEIFHDDYYRSLANNVGIYGINKYENGSTPWPCGIETGQTPGLMLGLSGIGYFYLRLYNSSKVPSILMIHKNRLD